jgi:hypothetical protein
VRKLSGDCRNAEPVRSSCDTPIVVPPRRVLHAPPPALWILNANRFQAARQGSPCARKSCPPKDSRRTTA